MRTAAAALLLLLLCAAGLRAHPILRNPLWADPAQDKLTLYLDVTVRELMVIQGLSVDTAGRAHPDAAADAADRHVTYVLDHMTVKADGQRLTGTVQKIAPPEEHLTGEEGPDNTRFRLHIEYPLPAGLPQQFSFHHTMCKEYPSAPGVPWDFQYGLRYGIAPGSKDGAKLFVELASDYELLIETGSGRLLNGAADDPLAGGPRIVEKPRQNHWLVLWGLFAIFAASGAAPLRLIHIQAALVAWLAGYFIPALSGNELFPGLAAILCSLAAIVLAIDNIHGTASGLRRNVLLNAGAFLFGWALFPQRPAWITSERVWPLFAVAAALIVGAFILPFAVWTRRELTPARRALRQMLSLLGSITAVLLFVVLVGIVDW